VLYLVALLAVAVGVGAAAASAFQTGTDRSDGVDFTGSLTRVEIQPRPGDTPAFLARLDHVVEEVVLQPGTPLSDAEVEAIVSNQTTEISTVDPGTVRTLMQLPSGAALLEFDQSGIAAEVGETVMHCEAIVSRQSGELQSPDSVWCWDPAFPPPPAEDDGAAQLSYGCRTAFGVPGLAGFGKGHFVAEISLPADAPGVIFTLENGDVILVRPFDDRVIYAGPIAVTMEIFHHGGKVDTVNTSGCR
jgi:hypothetical protein